MSATSAVPFTESTVGAATLGEIRVEYAECAIRLVVA